MKKFTLFTALFIVSTASFCSGFSKRWFWFYSANDEKYHVVITYDPENKESCSITSNEGVISAYLINPFDNLIDGNVGHWPNLFDFADKARKGELEDDFSVILPANDPLLRHIITEQTRFTVRSSGVYSKSINYYKVVFESKSGDSIAIYLENIKGNKYRVSALFLKSVNGGKYSYRDFNFKKDFGDGGSGSGGNAGTLVNLLHHPYDVHHRETYCLENKSLHDLVYARKRLAVPLEFLSKTFVYTYVLKLM